MHVLLIILSALIPNRKDELLKIFRKFDTNADNSISYDEARQAMRDYNFRLGDNEIKDMLQSYDDNKDGYLQFEEFVHFWKALGGKVPTKW